MLPATGWVSSQPPALDGHSRRALSPSRFLGKYTTERGPPRSCHSGSHFFGPRTWDWMGIGWELDGPGGDMVIFHHGMAGSR